MVGKRRRGRSCFRPAVAETTRKRCPALVLLVLGGSRWGAGARGRMGAHAGRAGVVPAHPRSGLYLRQIEVAGVHTKFIESRKGLLAELLDLCCRPTQAIDGGPRRLRVRTALRPAVPSPPCALPHPRPVASSGASTIWPPRRRVRPCWTGRRARLHHRERDQRPGLPRRAEQPGDLRSGLRPWSVWRRCPGSATAVHYWGDSTPTASPCWTPARADARARSFLMDRETVLAHRDLWGQEPDRCDKDLRRLTPAEQAIYQDLRGDTLGRQVRLEQDASPLVACAGPWPDCPTAKAKGDGNIPSGILVILP